MGLANTIQDSSFIYKWNQILNGKSIIYRSTWQEPLHHQFLASPHYFPACECTPKNQESQLQNWIHERKILNKWINLTSFFFDVNQYYHLTNILKCSKYKYLNIYFLPIKKIFVSASHLNSQNTSIKLLEKFKSRNVINMKWIN